MRRFLLYLTFLSLLPIGLSSGLPNFTVYGPSAGLAGEVVSAIATTGTDVWVNSWHPTTSGADGGISTYSFKTGNWTTFTRRDGLAADVLQGLRLDPKGNLWICHSLGVQVFDTLKREFVANYGSAEGLIGAAEDVAFQGENVVWVGTNEGIGRFDRSNNSWKMFSDKDGLVSNKVFSIAVDGDVLWIGTGGGAARFDTRSGQWKSYTTSDGLADEIINKVVVTDRYVWFATRSGLSRLDKRKGTVKSYWKAQGLPSDNVLDVAVFRGRVWVATSEGIGKYEGRWRIMGKDEGLPVEAVTCIGPQKDYIWFGTPSGVARYGPVGPGLSFGSPYFLVLIGGVILGALLVLLRPGAAKAKQEARQKKPREIEPTQTRKASYEICGGRPSGQLCTRCKFYTLRGNALNCAKYKAPITFPGEGEAKRLKQISKGAARGKPDQTEQNTAKES